MQHGNSIILFDGICNLCHASVQFVIKRDKHKTFKFAQLQSNTSQKLLQQTGLASSGLSSMVLIENGKAFRKSDAALRIARKLTIPWPLFYLFIIVPKFLRDRVYDFIGNHRYQWFGKMNECWLPDASHKDRFIDS